MKKIETGDEWKHAIHERIAKEIANSGYSYEELASYLGYESKGTVSKWTSFNHDTVPELPTIVAIANLFNVSLEYLCCITDERKPFHHDDPIDWTVIEDRSPKRPQNGDIYSLFKKMRRKNYLRFHRSKVGQMLHGISNTKTMSERFDRIVDGLEINKKSTILPSTLVDDHEQKDA